MDMKKEIKLSDLFKRKKVDAGSEDVKDAPNKGSGLRKEITLSSLFKRAPKEPKPETPDVEATDEIKPKKKLSLALKRERTPKEPKAPKEPKLKRARGSSKDTPPLSHTPLMRAFNLLPKEDVREKKAATRLKPGYAAAVLAAIVAVGGVGSMYMSAGAGLSDKRAQVSDLHAKIAAAERPPKHLPRGADPALVKEQDDRTAAVADVLAGRVAWDRTLRDIALVVPRTAWTWQIVGEPAPTDVVTPDQPAGRTLEIDGCAENQDDIAEFLIRLNAVPDFATITLTKAERQKPDDDPCFGRVNFTLTGTLKSAGAAAQ